MKQLEFSEYNWQAKAFWCASFALAVSVLVYAFLQITLLPVSKLITLALSAFVAVIANRYKVKLSDSGIEFSPKVIFAFWGIIWLGVSGGVLLGAVSAATQFVVNYKERNSAVLKFCVMTLSTLSAGFVYQLSYSYFESEKAGSGATASDGFMAAICFMTAAHYIASSLLNYIFLRLEGSQISPGLLAERFLYPAAAYGLTLVATALISISFIQFGIEFGLVIVPIVIGADLAYRVHSGRLASKTKQISDASRIHLATVEALATAIDARDQVGIGHVRRTQIYAIGIGKLLGLPEGEINALRTGALLHDIGKLAVPDHILNKPGRLTPAELEKTKIHASVGASILEKVGFDHPVVPTVRYHHECWDGSGYPEGLKGDNIPLTARILSVADAYDTLRGARPYRPPVSREEACDFLRNKAGTQFDPGIVSVFLKNRRTFEEEIDAQGLSYKHDLDDGRLLRELTSPEGEHNYVEQIKKANREVFTLYELARDFSSSLNLQETLSLFTQRISEFVPFVTCAVYLIDDSRDTATAAFVRGQNSTVLTGKRIKLGEGATGRVLEKRKSLKNLDPNLDLAASHPQLADEYVSMVSLPLIADEELIGAVTLYSIALAKYQEEHLRLLETISRIASDAVRRSLQHAEAEVYALTDPMTGLPNARSLQVQFEKEAGRANRNGTTFQVLMLDLDGFKLVNDTFGHKCGDRMLKEIGKVIRAELRDYDFLARYAGDEFVAVVPEMSTDMVRDLCRRIEKAVGEFVLEVGEMSANVGVSIGSAAYPEAGENFDQMIIAADKAMYSTKSSRKMGDLKESAAAPPAEQKTPTKPNSEKEQGEGFRVEMDETHIVSSAVN